MIRRPVTLPMVLGITAATLVVGFVLKQACFIFDLGQSYYFYCHSDLAPVYHTRELAGGRFPYTPPALEYPTGLGLILWMASALSTSALSFWFVNFYMLSLAGLVTVWLLWRQAGHRALFFAGAPSLALYAFLNWDLFAVACAVAAIAAFVAKRDDTAAFFVGLGGIIKIFPGLFVFPFLAQRITEKNWRSAFRLCVIVGAIALAFNVPFAVFAFDGWSYFFQFSSSRGADWGSLWRVGCHSFGWSLCNNVRLLNSVSLALFISISLLAWVVITRAVPHLPRWQLAFPLVVVFLLTNKVFSPQHSLWILPWFALLLPDIRLFLVYQAIDIGLYVTTFAWQQQLAGFPGLPLWPQNVFVVLRAAILVTMLVVFVRRAAGQRPH
jgi:uncharacterized membrane protein